MSVPKTLPEFYERTVHALYAVVIGLSFQTSSQIIVPIQVLNDNPVSAGILILGYGIIFSGWIGYFLSVKENKHRGIKGCIRFILDALTLFNFYYIISLAKPINEDHQKDVFLYLLPLMFGIYLAWDIIKYFEHKKKNQTKEEQKDRIHRIRITGDYLLWFLVLSIIYYQFLSYDENLESINLIFIIVSGILVILYRIAKYLDTRSQKTKTRMMRKKRSKKPD